MYARTVIVCEGKSECAYIQELNRYLREEGVEHHLHPEDAGGGKPDRVKAACKRVRLRERGVELRIWLDKDIYFRDSTLQLPEHIERLCHFTYWNFEDFLALHCEQDDIAKWIVACVGANHLEQPLHSDEVETLVRQHIFPSYQKGTLPEKLFPLTTQSLNNLFNNHANKKHLLRAEFTDFIKSLLP